MPRTMRYTRTHAHTHTHAREVLFPEFAGAIAACACACVCDLSCAWALVLFVKSKEFVRIRSLLLEPCPREGLRAHVLGAVCSDNFCGCCKPAPAALWFPGQGGARVALLHFCKRASE